MKNRALYIIIGGIALFVFIVAASIFWYFVFNKEEVKVGNMQVKLNDNANGVSVVNIYPYTDSEGENTEAYEFEIKNTGNGNGKYKLLIEETSLSDLKDGCTVETLLTRNELRYQLKLNGVEIVRDDLLNVKNNIIDFRSIEPTEINKYELRVWLKSTDNVSWLGKHYHYHVTVEPYEETE